MKKKILIAVVILIFSLPTIYLSLAYLEHKSLIEDGYKGKFLRGEYLLEKDNGNGKIEIHAKLTNLLNIYHYKYSMHYFFKNSDDIITIHLEENFGNIKEIFLSDGADQMCKMKNFEEMNSEEISERNECEILNQRLNSENEIKEGIKELVSTSKISDIN